MPEYLAPGVYVEEVSFRSKSIEGLSTTTTGFIGPVRNGPVDQPPPLLTSVGDFERVYGDRNQLNFDPTDPTVLMHNYLWHAVNAFFVEGGQRLYVMRVFSPFELDVDQGDYVRTDGTFKRGPYHSPFSPEAALTPVKQSSEGLYDDGHARYNLQAAGDSRTIHVLSRYPGSANNVRLRFTLRLGRDILGGDPVAGQAGVFTPKVGALLHQDVVWITSAASPIGSPPGPGSPYWAERYFDTGTKSWTWRFHPPEGSLAEAPLELADFVFNPDPARSEHIRVVTLTVTLVQSDGTSLVWDGLAFDPHHTANGLPDSLVGRFDKDPNSTLPIVVTSDGPIVNGLDVLYAIFRPDIIEKLDDPPSSDADRSVDVLLAGGNDGLRPGNDVYQGTANPDKTVKTGLKAFEDIDEISIIAAPGSTYGYEREYRSEAHAIINLLIAHTEQMRYRIAVIDSGDGQGITQVLSLRGQINSSYAALYYPWIQKPDPVTQLNIYIPPSGSVAGIYARNDRNRAVYKAPANEPVLTAIAFEVMINKAQQEVLNPAGVNCFRTFENGGLLLWGARTATNDPEWKYVNLRRYFAYLEHSIDKGTQWAVFEPNGEALWANVRRTISDFLLNEWQSGALLGDKPENAYFVRCDRSTMSQNDLDNGRLVCLIGVAPLRPAEFVIFRIGQWTGDRRG